MDACSLPPARQLLLGPHRYRGVNKRRTKQVTKRNKRAESEGDLTGPSLRRISPLVPYHQKQGEAEKGDLDMASSLGN